MKNYEQYHVMSGGELTTDCTSRFDSGICMSICSLTGDDQEYSQTLPFSSNSSSSSSTVLTSQLTAPFLLTTMRSAVVSAIDSVFDTSAAEASTSATTSTLSSSELLLPVDIVIESLEDRVNGIELKAEWFNEEAGKMEEDEDDLQATKCPCDHVEDCASRSSSAELEQREVTSSCSVTDFPTVESFRLPDQDVVSSSCVVQRIPGELLYRQDDDGDTYLHLSIIHLLLIDVIRWIIRGARTSDDLNLQNYSHRQTALHLAVITDRPDVVQALIAAGAWLGSRDGRGDTPIHTACRLGRLACLKLLLTKGPKCFSSSLEKGPKSSGNALARGPNYSGSAPVSSSTENHYQITSKQTVQLEAINIVNNLPNYDGEFCLHLAINLPQTDVADFLLCDCRTDVNVQELKAGQTALHLCAARHDVQMTSLLLLHPGVDVTRQTYGAVTATQCIYAAVQRSVPFYELCAKFFGHVNVSRSELWEDESKRKMTDNEDDGNADDDFFMYEDNSNDDDDEDDDDDDAHYYDDDNDNDTVRVNDKR